MRKIAFEPIADSNSCILLLGTMPGEESLRKKQYYGNVHNHFWKIIYTIFDEKIDDLYEDRVRFMLKHKIALWDVLASCEGEGSLDSNIKNELPNDFETFFTHHPAIKHIFFTSKKAESFYRRHIGLDTSHSYYTLPSPSPANARMTFEQKIKKWEIIRSIELF